MASSPIRKKVVGATLGAGSGAVIAEFVTYLVDEHIYTSSDVPTQVSAFIALIVTTGLAFLGGYLPTDSS